MWSAIIIAVFTIVGCLIVAVLAKFVNNYSKKARAAGYSGLGAYLQATPRDDEERRDAVDLALLGLIICVVGLVMPILLIFGLVPLYFGLRKLAYARMGFGLFEDTPK